MVGSGDGVARFVGDVFTTPHEVARPSWGGWAMDLLIFSMLRCDILHHDIFCV
jgi:hypothetical protein